MALLLVSFLEGGGYITSRQKWVILASKACAARLLQRMLSHAGLQLQADDHARELDADVAARSRCTTTLMVARTAKAVTFRINDPAT